MSARKEIAGWAVDVSPKSIILLDEMDGEEIAVTWCNGPFGAGEVEAILSDAEQWLASGGCGCCAFGGTHRTEVEG